MRRLAAAGLAAFALGTVPVAALAADGAGGSRQIFIKTLQGGTITLDVNDADSIGTVKDKIRDIEGIPVDQQQVWYSGRNLPDGVLMSSIGAPSAAATARESGRGTGARSAGPRMVLQTAAEARSRRSVRGAYAMARGRTAPLASIAAAGGLTVPRAATVSARLTAGGAGATVSGAALRATRAGAYRVVVVTTTRSGTVRRAPILVSVM